MWLLKTLKRSVNWLAHKKISLEPAEALERLLHRSSVQQIAKHDLRLTAFAVSSTGHLGHNLERCWKLLRRLPKIATKKMIFTDEKTFISTLLQTIRTTVFGLSGTSVRWMRIAFWFKEPILHHTSSWFRLAPASLVKDDFTSGQVESKTLHWYFATKTGCACRLQHRLRNANFMNFKIS